MPQAGKQSVAGTQVSGQTNVGGGADFQNGAVATLRDDVASINAARSGMIPIKRGTTTSWGRQMGVGAGGQTDGGY